MQTTPKLNHTLTFISVLVFALCLSHASTARAQWTTPDGNQNINNTNTGNVGVGTSSPTTKLDILSSINQIAKFRSSVSDNTQVLIDAGSSFNSNLTLQRGGVSKWFLGNRAANDRFSFIESTGGVEVLALLQNGKVGVGTTAPTGMFHIMTASGDGDALRIHRNANTNGWGVAQYFVLNNSSGAATDYAQISGGITSNTAGSESGVMAFYTRGSGTLSEHMRISNTGQVGIGTSSPVYSLDVNGGINSFRAKAASVSSNDTIATFENNSAIQMIVRANGSVGVGTTSPAFSLDVNGGVSAFRAKAGSVSSSDTIAAFENTSGSQMVVRANGNVGIGITNPSNKLHVNGSITVEGNINAKYQDLAEWVDSSQELAAGTVVVLDENKSNQVIASTQAYDSRVAGVISLQPGVVLGEAGEGRVLVATTGRVKVRVDAGNGPIKIGDLLVTSDKEGVAMKSLPVEIGSVRIHRPGTLIGKALEPLEKGTGDILVLLSLQ